MGEEKEKMMRNRVGGEEKADWRKGSNCKRIKDEEEKE